MTGVGLNGVVDVVSSGNPVAVGAHIDALHREWLQTMIRIREFEVVLDGLSMKGLIPGGVHAAIGQEAVAVGTSSALTAADALTCGHRAHHHTLAKGVDMNRAMAELFGRSTGVSGGRGGTMHMADMSVGLMGGNGIVGAGIGIALGSALAAMMRAEDRVAVGVVGDGGANTGRVWESVNMAALWKTPLIVICENNQYAVQTSITDSLAGSTIAARAETFGMPAVRIDGQDVMAVHDAVASARRHALDGGGPTFIEMVTYRYLGHSTGEAQSYRPDDEVAQWRELRDPITRLGSALIARGDLTATDIETMTSDARAEVAAAVDFAKQSPWPDAADALGWVAGVTPEGN